MKRWKSALQTWKFNWQDRGGGSTAAPVPKKLDGAERIQLNDEFKRCMEKMRTIRSQYGDHQTWSANDLRDFARIKGRWKELKAILNIQE